MCLILWQNSPLVGAVDLAAGDRFLRKYYMGPVRAIAMNHGDLQRALMPARSRMF